MDTNKKTKVIAFAGSLRKGSFNKALISAAKELAPEGMEIEIFDIAGIPLYNQDDEKIPPKTVVEFKEAIRNADAVLIATPEYNYSIPGVLKNAIDWASRPYDSNPFKGKPAAIMSASGSILGGSRAQYHLRQVFVFLDVHPLNKPEVIVPLAQEKIDAEGRITDQHTRERVKELLVALKEWSVRLGAKSSFTG